MVAQSLTLLFLALVIHTTISSLWKIKISILCPVWKCGWTEKILMGMELKIQMVSTRLETMFFIGLIKPIMILRWLWPIIPEDGLSTFSMAVFISRLRTGCHPGLLIFYLETQK